MLQHRRKQIPGYLDQDIDSQKEYHFTMMLPVCPIVAY